MTPNDPTSSARQAYLEYLIRLYAHHIVQGFSPRISGREISLPLAKIFLPPKVIEEHPLLTENVDEDLMHSSIDATGGLDRLRHRVEKEKRSDQMDVRPSVQKTISLAELLVSSRVVLLGNPGAGKTTVTRYIAYALAVKDYTYIGSGVNRLTPILVRLATYARVFEDNGTVHLIDYIERDFTPQPEFGRYLRHAVISGHCLIILDGLDEVTDPTLRLRITENIRGMVASYSKNRFLITSRIVGYDRSLLPHEFKYATLSELEADEQERFVQLWFDALTAEVENATAGDAVKNLTQNFHDRPQISRLAANPLLLTIVILMYWRGIKLPNRRVQIYENATDTLIEYWTTHRGVDLDAHEIKSILAPVAHYILSTDLDGVIAHHDLLPQIYAGIVKQRGCSMEEAHNLGLNLLKATEEQSGFFLKQKLDANGNPVYGFLSQAFCEYLAGLRLAEEVLDGSFEIHKYIRRSVWYEPLLLAAGHLSLVSQIHLGDFLQAILDYPCPPEVELHYNLLLAVDCIAEDVQLNARLRRELLYNLVKLLFLEIDQLREAAVERIYKLSSTRHKEATIEVTKELLLTIADVDSISAKVRYSIAHALVHLGEAKLAKPYLFPLEDDHYHQNVNLNKVQYLRLKGWPDEADTYLYELYLNKERIFYLRAEPDLTDFIFGVSDVRTIRNILGKHRMLELVTRLLKQAQNDEDKAIFQFLVAIVSEPVDVEALYTLLNRKVPPKARCLAAIRLLETQHRNESIYVLQEITATESNQADRAAKALVRIEQQMLSLLGKAQYYLTMAGFEVAHSSSSTFFVCKPQHQRWCQRIKKTVPVKVLSGAVLDMNMVLSIVEESTQLLGETPYCIFVICDRVPTDSAWLQIGAHRANGIYVMPIDDSVLITGIQQDHYRSVLLDHLEERYFSPQRDLYDRQNPISDRLNFFGREKLAEQLIDNLGSGHSVALFGLRKMGKTSLLHVVHDRLSYPAAVIDLEAGTALKELYDRIVAGWIARLRALQPGLNWKLPQLAPDETSSIYFSRVVRNLLNILDEAGAAAQIALFIDEIELIYPLTEPELATYLDFTRTLRGLAQEHLGKFGLVVAGVDPNIVRTNRFFGRQNPFYNFFHIQYLPPLNSDDCRQMIRNIGVQMGLTYEDEAVNFVAEVSGGHPYWARKLCSLAFQAWRDKGEQRPIPYEHLVKTARRFIQHPDTAQLLDQRGLWGEVTDRYLWSEDDAAANEAILLALAETEQSTRTELLAQASKPAAYQRSIIELDNRTIIDEVTDDTFWIHLHLFRNWIRTDKLGKE